MPQLLASDAQTSNAAINNQRPQITDDCLDFRQLGHKEGPFYA